MIPLFDSGIASSCALVIGMKEFCAMLGGCDAHVASYQNIEGGLCPSGAFWNLNSCCLALYVLGACNPELNKTAM
jgi:hypothetical protein